MTFCSVFRLYFTNGYMIVTQVLTWHFARYSGCTPLMDTWLLYKSPHNILLSIQVILHLWMHDCYTSPHMTSCSVFRLYSTNGYMIVIQVHTWHHAQYSGYTPLMDTWLLHVLTWHHAQYSGYTPLMDAWLLHKSSHDIMLSIQVILH